MDIKKCKKCGKELPLSDFYKNKACNDGLSSWCKNCTKQNSKQKYKENKEEIIEKAKQYYQDNKEKVLEYHKKYSKNNKNKINKVRNSNISEDRKYGRVGNNLPDNYPKLEDYLEILQQPDFYDKKQYHFSEMGVDRIDNNKPHTLDNIVPCSTKNNKKRGKTYTHEEFIKMMLQN